MPKAKMAKVDRTITSGLYVITDLGKVPLRAILESLQHLAVAEISAESMADDWTVYDLLEYGASVGVKLTHKSLL